MILPVLVHALLCPWGNADGCHRIQVKLQGTTNPKDSPTPQGCTCSLPASQTLSQPCCWRAVSVNDKEKQSHRAAGAHCAISVAVSFLPVSWMLPAGRAPSPRHGLAIMQ